MVRIGVFARLSEVSVKTLRHYDDIGLLAPAYVDDWSGYRYYTLEQLPRLYRILALRDLGFSLDEIAGLLRRNLPPAEMTRLLRDKQAEMQRRIAEEQARLARVETRLRQLEQENTMPDYDIRLKKVEPLLVASVRDTIPDWEQVTPTFNRLFDEVYGYATSQGAVIAGPGFDLWHEDGPPSGADMAVEAAFPIVAPIPDSERVKVSHLPAVETMASAIHRGPFRGIGQAHEAIVRWTKANGRRICGPSREVYLQYERDGDPSAYVTEVQYPVTEA